MYNSGCAYEMQIADWNGSYRVDVVNIEWEYLSRVGANVTEQLATEASVKHSSSIRCRDWIQCPAAISLSRYLLHWGIWHLHQLQNQSWWSQCQECQTYWRMSLTDDIWVKFQTGELVACGICQSHLQASEYQIWWGRKPIKYSPCFIWYLFTSRA